MNIHEYQAKNILKEFGVPVPNGVVILNKDEKVIFEMIFIIDKNYKAAIFWSRFYNEIKTRNI